MNKNWLSKHRWNLASSVVGGILWIALLRVSLDGPSGGTISRLLLLAILVLTPLTLSLAEAPERSSEHPLPYRLAQWVHPIAAPLVVLSFLLPVDLPASLLTLGWLLFAGLVALFGIGRLLTRATFQLEELVIDAGLVYIPVGAIWLLLYRFGAQPLGFNEIVVLLTAIHFHYTGFALPVIVGMTGRVLKHMEAPVACKMYRVIALVVILGTPTIAVGITLSRPLEVMAVIILSATLILFSALTLTVVIPNLTHRVAQLFLTISALSLIVPMLLATINAVGKMNGAPIFTTSTMVQMHGWVNAVGFVLCGLLGWTLLRPVECVATKGTEQFPQPTASK